MNKELREHFQISYDSYDPYGSCMEWLFAVCDYITFDTEESVPLEWHFKPSIFGADKDNYSYQTLKELEIDANDVLYFGNLLIRFRDLIKRKELDY